MPRRIQAAEANRQFSEILGQAAGGETVVITRRGEAVAQLVPFGRTPMDEGRAHAWDRLLMTLDEGVSLGGLRLDRDALYER